MSNEIARPAAFQAMQTDIQVSMDDVVSAFVSQYENNLYARKKELTGEIKALEAQLSNVKKTVKQEVTGDEYADHTLPFGLKIKVEQGDPDFERKKVSFSILVSRQSDQSYYASKLTISKDKPIPAKYVKQFNAITEELSDLRAALSDVLVSLKSVTRKERQVRGKIAIRKLEDSGYASLMQDAELIQLVQLDED